MHFEFFAILTGGGPLIALPSARLDAALQPTCAAIYKKMHETAMCVCLDNRITSSTTRSKASDCQSQNLSQLRFRTVIRKKCSWVKLTSFRARTVTANSISPTDGLSGRFDTVYLPPHG